MLMSIDVIYCFYSFFDLFYTYVIIKIFIFVLTELFLRKAATMIKLLTMPKIATAANTTDVTFQIESGKSGSV